MSRHVFIATANQCGSTLLQHLFAKCENAVHIARKPLKDTYVINEWDQYVRGQLPNMQKTAHGYNWTELLDQIRNPEYYQWPAIKKTLMDLWSEHPQFDNMNRVFIQKSPCDLGRVGMLQEEFPDACFVTQVRNPYVVAEGVKRRMVGIAECNIRRAGKHAIKVLCLAKENLEKYYNIMCWRYEDLPYKHKAIEGMVKGNMPLLGDFTVRASIPSNSVEGFKERKVIDLNPVQLSRLSAEDIKILNEEFDSHADVMNLFDYSRIQES